MSTLFAEWRSSLPFGHGQEAPTSDSTAVPIEYPMYVLPMQTLLSLDELPPHQQCLASSMLQPWSSDMVGKIIFVSHQWTAFEQPDPKSSQLRALQRVLQTLMEGKSDVQSDVMIPLMGKMGGAGADKLVKALTTTLHVCGEAWRKALPNMYLWIDWACVPQPNAALWKPSSAHGEPASEPVSLKDEGVPGADSDHRSKAGVPEEVLKELRQAVRSLPAYVELSEFLIVLAPPVPHADVRGRVCNLRSWFSRGWTRLEICAAFLARRPLPVLVISDHSADPPVPLDGGVGATAARRLLAARGRFTVESDRAVVAEVQLALLNAASARCRARRELVELFLLEAVKETLGQFGRQGGDAEGVVGVAALRERLGWDEEYMAGLGLSLLHAAAFLGDSNALAELLRTATVDQLNQAVGGPVPGTLVTPGMTPLMMANLSASVGGPKCVTALLKAKADPTATLLNNPFARITTFAVPFPLPAGVQADGTLEAWLTMRPEDTDQTVKMPLCETTGVLALAAQNGNLAQVRTLLRHGAKPSDSYFEVHGAPYNLLHQMLQTGLFSTFRATSVDTETLKAVLDAINDETQLDARSRVPPDIKRLNAQARRTYGRRLPPILRAAEVSGIFGHPLGGLTPLHQAVLLGEPELCAVLRDAGASLGVRTRGRWWRRGRTALELARAEFGAGGRNPAPGVLAMLEEVLAPGAGEELARSSSVEARGGRKTEKAGKLARSSWASGRVAADKVIPHGVVPPSEVG